MRVAQVINSLDIGGAERLVVDLAVRLNNYEGVECDVILLNGHSTFLMDELKKNGVTIYVVKQKNWLGCIISLRRLMKEYDIVHAHLFPVLYLVSFTRLTLKGNTKLFFTEHNTYNRRRDIPIIRPLEYFVYSSYYKVLCISLSTQQALLKHMPSVKDKAKLITNGINYNKFHLAKRSIDSEVNNVSRIIVQVASFTQQKDQDTVIRALSHLPDEFKLIFIGDGPRRKECEQLALQLKVNNRVSFLGKRSDVESLIKASDFVVLSSHWEGFGLAALEGMAAGKPTIVSDVAGLASVVGDAAFKFTKGNDLELASILENLQKDKKLYIKYSKLASEHAKKYDISNMVNKYLNEYRVAYESKH